MSSLIEFWGLFLRHVACVCHYFVSVLCSCCLCCRLCCVAVSAVLYSCFVRHRLFGSEDVDLRHMAVAAAAGATIEPPPAPPFQTSAADQDLRTGLPHLDKVSCSDSLSLDTTLQQQHSRPRQLLLWATQLHVPILFTFNTNVSLYFCLSLNHVTPDSKRVLSNTHYQIWRQCIAQ